MRALTVPGPAPAFVGGAPLRAGALRLEVGWAACAQDLHEAQALRYRVFVTEMGARLAPPAGTPDGLDVDYFDQFCDHLLVRAVSLDDAFDSQLVGTYRVLPPAAAQRAGGFYADTEFDLAPLAGLRAQAVELGRACVHPDWRSGAVIMALWGALCRYMQARRLDTMIGCASIGLTDGGGSAVRLWEHLRHTHLVALPWRVQPYTPLAFSGQGAGHDFTCLPLTPAASSGQGAGHDFTCLPVTPAALPRQGTGLDLTRLPLMPPLIKGYLRCGARLLGPPAFDAAFNTADLPMMMRLDDLPARHRARFLPG